MWLYLIGFWIDQVDDLITEYQRQDITVWGSARQNICDKLQKQVFPQTITNTFLTHYKN